MLPSKLILIDTCEQLTDAWRCAFANDPRVEVIQGDYFSCQADAMVSPANSFGYMDGGLDLAIAYELGQSIQDRVQAAIAHEYYGELPVGSALNVDTDDTRWPRLIVAPTMRVPEDVSHTVNAYLAFRAVLLQVIALNKKQLQVDRLLCPGLGTGIGGMSAEHCARQMQMAWQKIERGVGIPKPGDIHTEHFKMRAKI